MAIARVLPIIRRHAIIKRGIFITLIFPLSAAFFSIYHATRSPFYMVNKPIEAWNLEAYENRKQKLFTTQDFANNHTKRPYFEYNF